MGRIVAAQVIATLLASASCLVIDRIAALSAFLAGVVCVVPGIYVWLVSQRALSGSSAEGATTNASGMVVVVRSELGKYALLISLMAMVFVFVQPLNVVAFFATLVMLQLCAVVMPVWEARKLLKR